MAFRNTRGRPVPPSETAEGTPEQHTPGETSVQGEQAHRVVPGNVDLPPPPELGGFLQAFPRMAEAMHLQAQAIIALQGQNGNAGAVNQQRAAEPDRGHGVLVLERFRRMGPPSFKGESDPDVAEGWIRETEKIFRAIRCSDEEKVSLATFTLQDCADVWWASELRTVFRNKVDITWDEFLEVFREKFFPRHIQDQMVQEFLSLSQGSMTVREYETRFAKLEKFAPSICADERMRAAKFVYGLKGVLRSRISSQDHRTMASAVRAACLQEIEEKRYQEDRKVSQKPYSASSSSQDRKRKQYPVAASFPAQRQAVSAVPVTFQHPVCPHCGKRHGGECFRVSGKCFNCGEVGHKSRECPKPRNQDAAVPAGRATRPARVFTVREVLKLIPTKPRLLQKCRHL